VKIPLDLKAVLRGPALTTNPQRCSHGCYVPSGESTAHDLDGRAYCSGCRWPERIERRRGDSLLYIAMPVLNRRVAIPSWRTDTVWSLREVDVVKRLALPRTPANKCLHGVFKPSPCAICTESPLTDEARKPFYALLKRRHAIYTPSSCEIARDFRGYVLPTKYGKFGKCSGDHPKFLNGIKPYEPREFDDAYKASIPFDSRPGVAGEDYVEPLLVVEEVKVVPEKRCVWEKTPVPAEWQRPHAPQGAGWVAIGPQEFQAPWFLGTWIAPTFTVIPKVILDHSQPVCAKPLTNFCSRCFARAPITQHTDGGFAPERGELMRKVMSGDTHGDWFVRVHGKGLDNAWATNRVFTRQEIRYGLYVPQQHACGERADV
jgi:hypothetical protein